MKKGKKYNFLISYFSSSKDGMSLGQHHIISSQEILWQNMEDVKETLDIIKKEIGKEKVGIINVIKIG